MMTPPIPQRFKNNMLIRTEHEGIVKLLWDSKRINYHLEQVQGAVRGAWMCDMQTKHPVSSCISLALPCRVSDNSSATGIVAIIKRNDMVILD